MSVSRYSIRYSGSFAIRIHVFELIRFNSFLFARHKFLTHLDRTRSNNFLQRWKESQAMPVTQYDNRNIEDVQGFKGLDFLVFIKHLIDKLRPKL